MAYRDEEKYIPAEKLNENRDFLKFLLLNIVTLGLYRIFYYIPFSFDLDKVASRHDGKKTMNYLFAWVISLFTFSIVMLVWYYGVHSRIKEELERRKLDFELKPSDFWGWYFFGSWIIVGPYIFERKLMKAMNMLCKEYNEEQEQIAKEHKKSW